MSEMLVSTSARVPVNGCMCARASTGDCVYVFLESVHFCKPVCVAGSEDVRSVSTWSKEELLVGETVGAMSQSPGLACTGRSAGVAELFALGEPEA